MTSTALLLAAALTIAIGIIHSWLGERMLIGPLFSKEQRTGLLEKSEFARRVMRFAWHITTLAWWGMAAILVALAWVPVDMQGQLALAIIAATFFLTGAVILYAGRGRHLAWIVFFAIAGLSLVPLFPSVA